MIDSNHDKPNDSFPESLETDWRKVAWFIFIGFASGLAIVLGVILAIVKIKTWWLWFS